MQNYLEKVQKPTDLRARVDRLQAYRYIYQRLDVFVIRLEKNNQPQATDMRQTLQVLHKEIESFKNNYEAYDNAREKVTGVQDCRNNFQELSKNLKSARSKRTNVNKNVNTIKKLLGLKVETQLKTLEKSLLGASEGGLRNE